MNENIDNSTIQLPKKNTSKLQGLTPKQIVEELNKYIIGQEDAKRAVAVALRNRSRRKMLDEEMQTDVYPKNIIMIGPTGVGKTEIARRLAKLVDAPFIKVEATKFTEVGYVGRDVESMIRDLVEMSINRERARQMESSQEQAESLAEERLLDLLVPKNIPRTYQESLEENSKNEQEERFEQTRQKFREMLREGKLEDRDVDVDVKESSGNVMVGFPQGAGLEEMGIDIKDMLDKMMPSKKKRKTMKVKEARPLLIQEEAERLVDMDQIIQDSIEKVEQTGIVFLDEIDKVVGRDAGGGGGPDVSRSGVQRDILPLVEGSTVFTKYGMIKTDHILFIAAGAFHGTSPADLIPELQGRFPIRVELDDLTEEEFERILTEPKNSLLRQYSELLNTENVTLDFTEDGIKEMAKIATTINEETENIGARRLHTIMETLLDEVSFHAPEMKGQTVKVDAKFVSDKLGDIVTDTDLSRYIL